MTTTPLKAIHQHCYTCIVDDRHGNGTKREQTTNCTSHQCKLFQFRPVNTAEKALRNAEKLRTMSTAELIVYEANRAAKAKKLKHRLAKTVDSIGGDQ